MKTVLGGIPPRCLLTFQRKKSTVDSWSGCECPVSSAAHSRRVLLRVCSLFSCSPAVDQPLLTFQRSHGILTVAGSEGASVSAGLCYGQHGPPPLAAFTPRLSKKCFINGSVWTHQAHSQRHHFNFVCHATVKCAHYFFLENGLTIFRLYFLFAFCIYFILWTNPRPLNQLCLSYICTHK